MIFACLNNSNKGDILLKVYELGLNVQDIEWIDIIKIDIINNNDILIINDVSCFAKSTINILKMMLKLIEKQVKIHFIKSELDISQNNIIDCIQFVTQIENELISTNVKKNIQKKKREGIKLGRPAGKMKLDEHIDEIKKMIHQGIKLKVIANKFNSSDVSLSKFVKKMNLK